MKQRNHLTGDKYMTAREAYDRTLERRQYLIKEGYKMVEKWECDLYEELDRDPEMKNFFTREVDH